MDIEGFEPSASRMQNGRSTTELNAHGKGWPQSMSPLVQWLVYLVFTQATRVRTPEGESLFFLCFVVWCVFRLAGTTTV